MSDSKRVVFTHNQWYQMYLGTYKDHAEADKVLKRARNFSMRPKTPEEEARLKEDPVGTFREVTGAIVSKRKKRTPESIKKHEAVNKERLARQVKAMQDFRERKQINDIPTPTKKVYARKPKPKVEFKNGELQPIKKRLYISINGIEMYMGAQTPSEAIRIRQTAIEFSKLPKTPEQIKKLKNNPASVYQKVCGVTIQKRRKNASEIIQRERDAIHAELRELREKNLS